VSKNRQNLFLSSLFDHPLHAAAAYGFARLCHMLIYKGHDIAGKDATEYTPLHYAAVGGHSEVCRLLLKAGADVNIQGFLSRTPLYEAAKYGQVEVCEVLIAAGAEVNGNDIVSARVCACIYVYFIHKLVYPLPMFFLYFLYI
jgi:Ankyrin repeats (3 copies)